MYTFLLLFLIMEIFYLVLSGKTEHYFKPVVVGVFISLVIGFLFFKGYMIMMMVLESYMIFLSILFNACNKDGHYLLVLGPLILTSSLFFLMVLMNSGCLTVLLILILFKMLLINLSILSGRLNDKGLSSKGVVMYLVNSKVLLLIYATLSTVEGGLMTFNQMFPNLFYVLFLMVFTMTSTTLLVKEDFEGYFLTVMNNSQLGLILACLLSFKLFLMGFFVDILIFLIFMVLVTFGGLVNLKTNGSVKNLVMFLFFSYTAGMPPFPTYLMELLVMASIINNSSKLVSVLFLVFIFTPMLMHYYAILKYLGSFLNCKNLSSGINLDGMNTYVMVFLGTWLVLVFQFLMLYGI